jgi:hypothetical protein
MTEDLRGQGLRRHAPSLASEYKVPGVIDARLLPKMDRTAKRFAGGDINEVQVFAVHDRRQRSKRPT